MTLVDPSRLPDRLRTVPGGEPLLRAVEEVGAEVYLVGGAVRDLWLGGRPVDLDLAVVGDVGPLAARLGSHVRPHERFQTATVEGPDHTRYDLAATRRETYAAPGALPDVAPAGIEEDLRRRDFTVNALALGLAGPQRGELVSVADGPADVDAGRLRVLHDASFLDDPTRLLRLARYAGRLSSTIDPATERLARAAVIGGALDTVSGPRLGAELELLAHDPGAVDGFGVLRGLGIDAAIAPGLGIGDPAAVRRSLTLLAHGGPHGVSPGSVLLATALLDVPVSGRRELLDRLGLDRHLRRVVLAAAAGAPGLARRLPVDGPPSALVAVLPPDEPATIALAGGLGTPAVQATLRRWFGEFERVRLAIDGSELIAAGVPRGPIISVALRAALGARLDGRAPDREAQLAAALDAARAARAAGDRGDPDH